MSLFLTNDLITHQNNIVILTSKRKEAKIIYNKFYKGKWGCNTDYNVGMICAFCKLPQYFLIKHQNFIMWDLISKNKKFNLTKKLILNLKFVHINEIIHYKKISEDLIRFIIDKNRYENLEKIFIYQDLSIDFIKKYYSKRYLNSILKYQKIDICFLMNHFGDLISNSENFYFLIKYQNLTDEMIDVLSFHFDNYKNAWNLLFQNQILSSKILKKYSDKFDLYPIVNLRNYTTNFILENNDKF